jgi:hypothetical protein
VEAGAAFSWLANLRHTANYDGSVQAALDDSEQEVVRALLILNAARACAWSQARRAIGLEPGASAPGWRISIHPKSPEGAQDVPARTLLG